jgi:hypothetical protein
MAEGNPAKWGEIGRDVLIVAFLGWAALSLAA